jgi:hypothetical protein
VRGEYHKPDAVIIDDPALRKLDLEAFGIRRYEPVPSMVECHTTALAAFRAGIPPVERIPWSGVVAVPLGIPIVVDPSLPTGAWRVLDRDGNVLHEGTVRP